MDASAKPIGIYSRRVQNQINFIPDVAQFYVGCQRTAPTLNQQASFTINQQ